MGQRRLVPRLPRTPRASEQEFAWELGGQLGTVRVRGHNGTASDPRCESEDGSVPLRASTPLSVPQALPGNAANRPAGP